jgi:hypothetical protein
MPPANDPPALPQPVQSIGSLSKGKRAAPGSPPGNWRPEEPPGRAKASGLPSMQHVLLGAGWNGTQTRRTQQHGMCSSAPLANACPCYTPHLHSQLCLHHPTQATVPRPCRQAPSRAWLLSQPSISAPLPRQPCAAPSSRPAADPANVPPAVTLMLQQATATTARYNFPKPKQRGPAGPERTQTRAQQSPAPTLPPPTPHAVPTAPPPHPPPRAPRGTVPIPQTVPLEAHALWARVALRSIEAVLAAVDRGHGEGVASTMDILLALPAKVLPDRRVSRVRQRRLERLERREPLESESDTESQPQNPRCSCPLGTTERLRAIAIHRNLARGNVGKAPRLLELDARPSPPLKSSVSSTRCTHPRRPPPSPPPAGPVQPA